VDTFDLAPTAMAAGGDAIARDADGRVVFVVGALPGEHVRALVVSARKDFARAVVVEVLEASADRVAPPCAARVAGCGGCAWQHVARTAQPRLKLAVVEDALRRIGRFGRTGAGPDEWPRVTVRPAGPHAALRTTARLGVEGGRAGHRRSGSHDLVATEVCNAVHPSLEELVVAGRFPGADEVLLRIGVASGERAAAFDPPAAAAGAQLPDDVEVGEEAVVHEGVAGAWLQVSMGSFFQPGPVAAEALVAAVDSAIGDALPSGGTLVDAYAGVGLFGATIGAARAARVIAIESDRSAVADARVNLADVDAVVVAGEVGRWRPARRSSPEVVVADPARSGLGRPGVGALAASGAARLVLVSCDPASLARDARLLADAGFHLSDVELVDVFPDTVHVETVSRFDRR
jgi:23S rRNA (uracil1939-C5)-methyltransferase